MKTFNVKLFTSMTLALDAAIRSGADSKLDFRGQMNGAFAGGDLQDFKRTLPLHRAENEMRKRGLSYSLTDPTHPKYLEPVFFDVFVPMGTAEVSPFTNPAYPGGGSTVRLTFGLMKYYFAKQTKDNAPAMTFNVTTMHTFLSHDLSDAEIRFRYPVPQPRHVIQVAAISDPNADVPNQVFTNIAGLNLLGMQSVQVIGGLNSAQTQMARKVTGFYVDIPAIAYNDVNDYGGTFDRPVSSKRNMSYYFCNDDALVTQATAARVYSALAEQGLIPDQMHSFFDRFVVMPGHTPIPPLDLGQFPSANLFNKFMLAGRETYESPSVPRNFIAFLNKLNDYENSFRLSDYQNDEQIPPSNSPAAMLLNYYSNQTTSVSDNHMIGAYFQLDADGGFNETAHAAVLLKPSSELGGNATEVEIFDSPLGVVSTNPGPWLAPPSNTRNRVLYSVIKIESITLPRAVLFDPMVGNSDTPRLIEVKYQDESIRTYYPSKDYTIV